MQKFFLGRSAQVGYVALAILASVGCSQKMPPPPATYPVRGTVTLDGQPVAGGEVRLVPNDAEGLAGTGEINEKGEYSASSYMGQEGLKPGKYKVFIHQYPPGFIASIGTESTRTPEKYHSEHTSGLEFTVQKQDNTYDIDLKGGEGGGEEEASE